MSGTAMALPSDHPMMVAWEKFCDTDEFKSALRWAVETRYGDGRYIDDFQREQHAKGAMWLAFTKALERALIAEDALRGLMQYMGSTVDIDTDKRNGTMIEDVHVSSERFMAAYDAAVEVLEPK